MSPIYERIKLSGALPSPTGVSVDLFQLARNSEAKIQDIIAVVESDPATAGRILKFANSAYAGVRQQVSDIRRAVVLLGMRTVVNIAMGFSLITHNRRGVCEAFDYEEFWSDSALRATAARRLARDPINANEAYTCGLLSQIGRLAMASVFPEQYGEILRFCRVHAMAKIVDLERKMFEIDHNQLTAEMMLDWQLPEDFALAVQSQDAPHKSDLDRESPAGQLANLLHLGGLMGPLFDNRDMRREYMVNILAAAHRMSIQSNDFPAHFDAISEEWEHTGEIFPIRTHHVGTWQEVHSRCRQPVMAAPPSASMLGTHQQSWLGG